MGVASADAFYHQRASSRQEVENESERRRGMKLRVATAPFLTPLILLGLSIPAAATSIEMFGEPLTEGLEETSIQEIEAL